MHREVWCLFFLIESKLRSLFLFFLPVNRSREVYCLRSFACSDNIVFLSIEEPSVSPLKIEKFSVFSLSDTEEAYHSASHFLTLKKLFIIHFSIHKFFFPDNTEAYHIAHSLSWHKKTLFLFSISVYYINSSFLTIQKPIILLILFPDTRKPYFYSPFQYYTT